MLDQRISIEHVEMSKEIKLLHMALDIVAAKGVCLTFHVKYLFVIHEHTAQCE